MVNAITQSHVGVSPIFLFHVDVMRLANLFILLNVVMLVG